MYLALETEKFNLPTTRECVAFSADSKNVMAGPGAWRDLQQVVALALQTFFAATDATSACWLDDQAYTDGEGARKTLITAYFGTDAPVSREQLASFGVPFLRDASWADDGVHRWPDAAFPTLAMRGGQLWQLWDDDGTEAGVYVISGIGARVSRSRRRFSQLADKDFLHGVRHAVAVMPRFDPERHRQKRQLSTAFALATVRRIVDADGVVAESEKEFLANLFSAEELSALWLDDDAMVDALARDAAKLLPPLLGHHEKLALLSMFYAASYADGRVEVRELKVLKEAAATLGLDPREVVAQLKRIL